MAVTDAGDSVTACPASLNLPDPLPLCGRVTTDLWASLQPRFKFVRVLGTGGHAIVGEAIDTSSGDRVAIKAIGRADRDKEIQMEIAVLKHVDNPNCIKLLSVEQTPTHTYLVLEICSGGELFERILRHGPFSEAHAKQITRNLFHSVASLHAKGIMHRDLKLENILLSKSSGLDIRIADFGLATMSSRAHDMSGSLQYMAPEIAIPLNQGYSSAVDCWSLGIVLHGLVLGFLPYNFEDTSELAEFASGAPPAVELFGFDECARLSPIAKDLISKLLVIDPRQRLSAKDALAHPWLTAAGNTKSVRQTKRKSDLVEVCDRWDELPRSRKRRQRSESFENLFPDSPDCPAALAPRCTSLEPLELPACMPT